MTGLLRLTGSILVRALREGLLVRALAWPGLLTALALIGAAAAVAVTQATEITAVSDPVLAAALEEQGLEVRVTETPQQALQTGAASRGIWHDGETWVLETRLTGRDALVTEAVLRDHAQAAWRLDVPPLERRDARTGLMTGLMVGLLAVLFTLYGVVFGAGSLLRDREDGTLEAERALPVPDTTHAAARLLASGLLLGLGLSLSVALLDVLMGVDDAWAWSLAGSAGGVTGAAIGLGAMASGGESLSGPLARGMTVAMALLGVGWALPTVGAHLPIGSIGALIRGQEPTLAVLVGTAACGVLACWRFAVACR